MFFCDFITVQCLKTYNNTTFLLVNVKVIFIPGEDDIIIEEHHKTSSIFTNSIQFSKSESFS